MNDCNCFTEKRGEELSCEEDEVFWREKINSRIFTITVFQLIKHAEYMLIYLYPKRLSCVCILTRMHTIHHTLTLLSVIMSFPLVRASPEATQFLKPFPSTL